MVRPSRSSPRKRAAHRRLYLVFSFLSFFPTILSDMILYLFYSTEPRLSFSFLSFFHYSLRRSIWLVREYNKANTVCTVSLLPTNKIPFVLNSGVTVAFIEHAYKKILDRNVRYINKAVVRSKINRE